MKQIKIFILFTMISIKLNAQKDPFSLVQTNDGWGAETLLKENQTTRLLDEFIVPEIKKLDD